MSETEHQKLVRLAKEAVRTLHEHFDSVQILCTKVDGTTTHGFSEGCGNVYARIGQAREYLIRDKAQTELLENTGNEEP